MKNNKISIWLDSKYDDTVDPIYYRLLYNNLDNYYKENSKELKINNNNKINELKNFSKLIKENNIKYENIQQKRLHKKLIIESNLIQIFNKYNKNYYMYLDHNTNRYHLNMLFNKIIDYCIKNNYYDHINNPLINLMLRNKFYEFCFENTNI